MGISIIVGLGNPGDSYAATRHNVGFWLLDQLAADAGATLKAEKKVLGYVAQAAIANNNVRLLRPATYMNESGQSVRRMLDFYKVDADQLLVLHDELDLPPGTVRMKRVAVTVVTMACAILLLIAAKTLCACALVSGPLVTNHK